MTAGGSVRRGAALAWRRWRAIARVIGDVQARALLTLFYFAIVPLFALIVKLGADPLGLKPPTRSGWWRERSTASPGPDAARRQF